MEYIWEEKDLSWGRYIIMDSDWNNDTHKGLTHVMKVGGGKHPCLICMGDGLVLEFENRKQLIEHINKESLNYRPLRKREFIEMIEHNWDYHEGIIK